MVRKKMKINTYVISAIPFFLCFFIFNYSKHLEAKNVLSTNRIYSICDINANKHLYIGKNLLVHAIYQSDGGSFSYFKNSSSSPKKSSCAGGDRIISTAGFQEVEDRSVKEFFDVGYALCAERKSALCLRNADVLFKAQVIAGAQDVHLRITNIICYHELSTDTEPFGDAAAQGAEELKGSETLCDE